MSPKPQYQYSNWIKGWLLGTIFFSTTSLVLAFWIWLRFHGRNFEGLIGLDVHLVIWMISFLVLQAVHASIFYYLEFGRKETDTARPAMPRSGSIYTQKEMAELIRREMHRAARYHLPLSLCFMDLDDFGAIKQRQGQKFADALLHQLEELLTGIVRSSDYVACFGENEYTILLCHTDLVSAEAFLYRALLQTQERMESSFCAGLTSHRAGETPAEFLRRAKAALEQARLEGSRKVHCTITKDDAQVIKNF